MCSLLTSLAALPSPKLLLAPAVKEIMETYVELIQRLLDIQSGGRPRSPKLVAEDERLMEGLQKRNLARRSPQPKEPGPDIPRAA